MSEKVLELIKSFDNFENLVDDNISTNEKYDEQKEDLIYKTSFL